MLKQNINWIKFLKIMETLTRRELEIAQYVAKDLSEKMIASKLFIAPGTVHKHTSNIRKKWEVNTAVGIAVKYLQTLENPKNFILGCFFLCIQSFIICTDFDYEMRRRSASKRILKIGKTLKT
jgi:DNA-binding CsgD family transcriptional regulator